MRRFAKAVAILYMAQALLGLAFGVYVGIFHGDEADAYIHGLIAQIGESINAAR